MEIRDEANHQGVTKALQEWRQGDCVVGNQGFLFRSDPANPLTRAGGRAAAFAGAAEVEVPGFMVVTQTCDIVRCSADRPFVEACPLVRMGEQKLREIQRGHRPRYAFIPGLAERQLVADLDCVMTVEKSVVTNWKRVPGCQTDDDQRRLSQALSRKFARFAFPDDFASCVESLREHVLSKHDKNTDEGRALRAIDEIRVRAAPSWEADRIDLNFLFIRGQEDPGFEQQGWSHHRMTWLELIEKPNQFERFKNVNVLIMPWEELRAKDYVGSDPLDFDHLSTRGE